MGKRLELDSANGKFAKERKGFHTAYVGNERTGKSEAGTCKQIHTQTFLGGRTENVSEDTRTALRQAGVVR